MKFLVLFLISFNLFAQSEFRVDPKDIDHQVMAEEKLSRLDARYKAVTSYCAGRGYHADLIVICETKLKKFVVSEFGQQFHHHVGRDTKQGHDKVIKDIQESKCVVAKRLELDGLALPYNGAENCGQLKVALQVYYESLGSGSGG